MALKPKPGRPQPPVMISRALYCTGCGRDTKLHSYGPAAPPIGRIWCWPCELDRRTPKPVSLVKLAKTKPAPRPAPPAAPAPPPDRQTCWTHKVRYLTETEARQAHNKLRTEHRGFRRRMYPYLCQHCGGWHLTKKANYKPRKVGIW